MAAGRELWAFKLGGTIPARPMPTPLAAAAPRATETDEIETATMVETPPRGVGRRYALDEHTFNPVRARVKVGTRVSFINNGTLLNTIVADDGSWTTPTLKSADIGYVTFSRPGVYTFHSKERPWMIGQVVVEP